MSEAQLGESRGAVQVSLIGGLRDDDLQGHWAEFIAEEMLNVRVDRRLLPTCTACSGVAAGPNIFVSAGHYGFSIADWEAQANALTMGYGLGWDPAYDVFGEEESIVVNVLAGVSGQESETLELNEIEDVLRHLRDQGLDEMADDLEDKKCLIEEDPDDLPVSLESAREFFGFVSKESLAGSPSVTVDSYGHVGLEWIIPDPGRLGPAQGMVVTGRDDDHVWGRGDGVLGVWFLPTGMVRVCGTSGPVGQGIERMRVNSIVPSGYVMGEVKPFLSRLEDV